MCVTISLQIVNIVNMIGFVSYLAYIVFYKTRCKTIQRHYSKNTNFANVSASGCDGAPQQAASRMYFNSQFFPQFGQGGVAGMMGGAVSHPGTGTSVQHSMNMLYMDSIQRQEHCTSGKTRSYIVLVSSPFELLYLGFISTQNLEPCVCGKFISVDVIYLQRTRGVAVQPCWAL